MSDFRVLSQAEYPEIQSIYVLILQEFFEQLMLH